MNKKISIYLLFLTIFSTLISCSDWLTVQPKEVLSEDEMFETKSGFYDALYGVYSNLKENYGHNGGLMTTTIEHLAAQWEVAPNSTQEHLRNHNYSEAGQQPFARIFENQYKLLVNVNNILKYLEIQGFLIEDDYKLIKGECLALRAWLHFDLMRLWGPIPGKNNASRQYLRYALNASYERHPFYYYTEYMELLRKDLDEAELLLSGFAPENNYRLNYWGVIGLQARLNWWEKDEEKALEYAQKIIDYVGSEENGSNEALIYRLGTLTDIGLGDYTLRAEHLFGIFVNFETTPFQNSNTLYNTTYYLQKLYENSGSDMRTRLWTNRSNQTGQAEAAKDILKYLEGSRPVPIIRLSEIYFIAMQCGDLKDANVWYKSFCEARGIPETVIQTQSDLDAILYKEYRKEFFGEGVMFYYYKWHETVNIPRNPNKCTARSYVLALPQKEIDVNS